MTISLENRWFSRRRPGWLLVLALVLTLVNGCKSPDDYLSLPEISEVAEEAPDSESAAARRKAELETVAKEPYPEYRINSGDVFWLRVYDHPDLDVQDTVITPDGYIAVGLVGQVKVAGMTIAEATELINKQLSDYIKHPRVLISPRSINSQMATLAGKVTKSGRFQVDGRMRLADLIAMGEGLPNALSDGLTVELADLSSSVFVRGGKILPIDFAKAMHGDPLHNVVMRSNDYVFVASRVDKIVSVIGEVVIPRYVTWYPNIGVLEAISNTRGLKDTHWNYALIIRGGMSDPKVYRIDLDAVMAGKIRNPRLEPGDILYVPKDNISEYNVFIEKLMPTGQLVNLCITPGAFFVGW